MERILVIGDVHGKMEEFFDLLSSHQYELSVQIGDLGFKEQHDLFRERRSEKDLVLFGNHDHYPYVGEEYSLGDFGFLKDGDVFYVRGAESRDRVHRTYGVDLFHEEELSYRRFQECLDFYVDERPSVVLTHDAPMSVSRNMFGVGDRSRTSLALDRMFEEHKPDLWVFGHFHKYMEKEIKGTRFVCLEENGYLYLPFH